MRKLHELKKQLELSRNNFLDTVNKQSANTFVYHNKWRVKDIMANIAFWEYEGAKSLEAFHQSNFYHTPNFSVEIINEINERNFQRYKDKNFEGVLQFFQQGRKKMMSQIKTLQDGDLEKTMMCPWAMTSTVEKFINEMIIHEIDHLSDIQKTLH